MEPMCSATNEEKHRAKRDDSFSHIEGRRFVSSKPWPAVNFA
ncbi:MAG: hypothetical protein JWP21_3131, partial [Tardiphaga sp.]|nr:hypothetical protein [Tardiphaga sp.]